MTFGDIIYLVAIGFELLLLPSLAVYIISITVSWLHGAPYVATRGDELDEILYHARKYLKKHAQFVELGCGDGRITRMVSKKYGVAGIGYDINPLLIGAARILTRFEHITNAQFYRKNVLQVTISNADVIYIYLLPPIISKLERALVSSIKKDALIISHAFKIPYLQKYLIDQVDGIKFKTYYYRHP
jgi:hypothetical protein